MDDSKKKPKKQKRWKHKWRLDHNTRRRDRYSSDPEYREAIRQRTRENYYKNRDVVRDGNVAVSDSEIENYGCVRPLVYRNSIEECHTYTVHDMAEVLGGYAAPVIFR